MNRSAVKFACTLLLGIALGWGFGHMPGWSNGTKGKEDPHTVAGAQGGAGTGHSGNMAGSGSKAGIAGPGAKPSQERVEMLVAAFRNRADEVDETANMRLMMDIAGLSAEEIGPVTELLAEGDMGWDAVEYLTVRWGMLDPKAAMEFAAGQEGLTTNGAVMSSILSELAKVDSPAAKAALELLEETVQ